MEQEYLSTAAPAVSSEDAQPNNAVIDVGIDNFMEEVIEASRERLVLLDFWAEWCEPCKQLTPILASLAEASGGALRLAKMDIDAHPQIAQQMQVQSIPAVFLFKDGAPIDGFLGAQSEAQLREFLAKHINLDMAASGVSIEAAQGALSSGDVAGAAELFSQILSATPDGQEQDEDALAGLAACHIQQGNALEAQMLLDSCADSSHPDIIRLRAQLSLANKAPQDSGADETIAALQKQLDATPDNHQLRYDLALAEQAADNPAAAIEALLYIIDRAREWNEGAAHKQLLEIFAAYSGAADDSEISELIASARRRLSSILFR